MLSLHNFLPFFIKSFKIIVYLVSFKNQAMKKALLLLFLVFSFSTYAQPPLGLLNPYSLCDNDANPNDGYTSFDLQLTNPIGSLGLNSAIYSITFHPSVVDATNNVNVILNPSAYTNVISNYQIIGVRFVNSSNNEVNVSGMEIIVSPLPTANPAQLTFCDPLELVIYNLDAANNQITVGVAGSIVSYHETLVDAQIGANPVGPTYFPLINPGQQVLYARVQNTANDCFSISTLTLNTQNCGACPTPTNLAASQVTDTSYALSWTSNGPLGYSLACIVPQGIPPSDANAVITSTGPGPYVFTGLNPNACYSVYVKSVCSPTTSSQWSAPLNICMQDCANNGVCSQALVLTAFLDSNNNGIKDTGEVNFNNGNFVYQINDSGMNLYGNSNNGSYYIFDANSSNSYDISFAVNSELGSYYTSSVSHNNITLPSGSGATTLYFPIVNILPHVDARVSLYPSGQPRPGFTYENIIAYQNYGSQTIANGTLTFIKDPNLSITSISQTGTTPTSTGFTYDFVNLAPFEVRYIIVNFTVPTIPTVNLGDLLTNTATVQINNDADLTNNAATLSQIVVGSYDPNDKSESHGGRIGLDTFTNNDYLYYTINFENTGTASAEFIRLEDVLDARLDESTFEMINASHTVNTKREGNQLTWNFRTINLPPTITNPNDSHGYVYFRIKPSAGYVIGDIIPNTASIYFDYNPAIVTNTFNTEFFQTLGTTSFSNSEFLLYPNPAKSIVHITQNSNQSIENIQFYDVAGKTVKIISNVSNYQTSVDISALAKGIYFVEITSENNIKQTKKLIIQ